MAKPWDQDQDLNTVARDIMGVTGNQHAEAADTDAGTHVRTRPGEGYTPPGGGRPGAPSIDNEPLQYNKPDRDQTFGVRDDEEADGPPPPVKPKRPNVPQDPSEFEAVWAERAERARLAQQEPTGKLLGVVKYDPPITVKGGETVLVAPYDPMTGIGHPQIDHDLVVQQLEQKLHLAKIEATEAKRRKIVNRDIKIHIRGGQVTRVFLTEDDVELVIELEAALAMINHYRK